MSRITNILVPVDFSEHSDFALDYAMDIARSFGAKLHVVHAYSLPMQVSGPYDVAALPGDYLQQIRDAAAGRLQEARQKVTDAGLECEATLCDGSPAEAIVETAKASGADLIVMGTRGHTGLKHVLLGSVAERTVRIAPCPVLTARRP